MDGTHHWAVGHKLMICKIHVTKYLIMQLQVARIFCCILIFVCLCPVSYTIDKQEKADKYMLFLNRWDGLLSWTQMASGASFLHPSLKTTLSLQVTPRSPKWRSPILVLCSTSWSRTTTPTTSTMTWWTQNLWNTLSAQKTPSSLRLGILHILELPENILHSYLPHSVQSRIERLGKWKHQ